MGKIYFNGLDGLRGVAAITVAIGHIELVKNNFNFKNLSNGDGPFFLYLGGQAVTFFFVLSGFLITFLLLKEKEQKGSISIRNFYLRRIIRIWPVYYVLFILGFLILPHLSISRIILPKPIDFNSYWNSFFCNLVLLPNFANVSNPIAFQSWSIGVEEQFYIFWPILVYKIKSIKKLFVGMLAIVIGIYLLRSGMYLNSIFELKMPFLNTINEFFGESRFDNMAIGGIFAILFYKYPDFRFSIVQKTVIVLCAVLNIYKQTKIGFGFDNIIAATIFACLILFIVNKQKFIVLNHPFLLFSGKISYGIYMYHVVGTIIAINIILFFIPDFNGTGFQINFILYCLMLIVTILISFLSYHFMEKRILKYKNKLN